MVAVLALQSQTFLGHNQDTYQQLRSALQINLRRQLLLAVCDDGPLQAQLAHCLETDLNPAGPDIAHQTVVASPLVTLHLDASHPDLVREVLLWLKQQRWLGSSAQTIPAFQILGIETLTRQSPAVQNRFLASLLRVDALLTQLDCRLLVWLPRPWLAKIQQTVPGFWRSRSGLFEFAGDPTPYDWQQTQSAEARFTPAAPLAALTAPSAQFPNSARENAQDAATDVLGTDILGTEAPNGSDAPPASPEAIQQDSTPALSAPTQGFTALRQTDLPDLPPDLAEHPPIADLWHYIQLLREQQAGPLTLARAHLGLGQLCRAQVERGDRSLAALEATLAFYQRAITGLLEGEADWCDALNDLASLYWLRSQAETEPHAVERWLRRSVATYEQVLSEQTSASAGTLSRVYSNLGSVYGLLADWVDPINHLTRAAQVYRQALSHLEPSAQTLDAANVYNSLGAIQWRLSQLDQPPYHLQQAIAAYEAALHHRPAEAAPQEHAMIQNNLGIAYWSLAQHEKPVVWLERAIAAYEAALAYRTLETTPAGCATTHNNLGTALWDLAQQQTQHPQQRRDTLQRAVMAYEAALDAAEQAFRQSPSTPLGFDLWATCHSAGVVHDQLAQATPTADRPRQEAHLKAALGHYLLAYQGWQQAPDNLDILANAVAYTVRLNFELLGMAGQQAALSQLPPDLLAQVLPRL